MERLLYQADVFFFSRQALAVLAAASPSWQVASSAHLFRSRLAACFGPIASCGWGGTSFQLGQSLGLSCLTGCGTSCVAPSVAGSGWWRRLRLASSASMAGSKLVDAGFLAGNSSSKSFRDALSGNCSSFPDLKILTHRGLPSLWISEAEVLSLALPFEFSLVGKFPSHRPSLEAIRKFFFNLKLNGEFSVTVLNAKNILIKLADDLDYCRVFAHCSYFINNCYMRLIKWSPSFDVNVESPVVPIWVSFPNLRPHLFSPRILQGLGSIIGRPLKIDQATSVGFRPSVARILVELDVSKQHPDKVWVGPDNLGYV
ncbi:hypothetical protein M5K25_020515 [Dendrobium thyrsiflorum]|uniref:DUF4283 domain-containing protein n=1 Tax=Dendrobium thyrsiflorum TaxID=117978 RepID=A0ABD0UA19_DENTH